MVPPTTKMPDTSFLDKGTASPLMTPCQPLRKPTMDEPCSAVPRLTTARIAALRPGQSPPPVSNPIRMCLPSVSGGAPIGTDSNVHIERHGEIGCTAHLIPENGLDRV